MNTKSLRFALPALACCLTLLACTKSSDKEQASETASTPQTTPQTAQADPYWDYESAGGPSAWGQISPKYATCGAGQSQSPIDISTTSVAELPPLQAQYRSVSLHIVHHAHKADVVNTGHTIQINYPDADSLSVGTETFGLLQYHFHSPSEHTVNGRHSPMEMHMVHKSAAGNLAVVGVFIEEGAPNAAFDPVWANLPAVKGSEQHLEDVKVDVNQLLPIVRTTYRYDGSLTTPPCSESVKWLVMTTPIQLSATQIGTFRAIIQGNNRPVQPLNGRIVLTDALTE